MLRALRAEKHPYILKFVGMLFGFIFLSISRDLDIATFMFPAPRLAFPCLPAGRSAHSLPVVSEVESSV